MYNLTLTEDDFRAICYAGGRYEWSRAILFYLEEGDNEIAEPMAWEIAEAFEADTEGGHSPFPCLNPASDLYDRLLAFWQSIV